MEKKQYALTKKIENGKPKLTASNVFTDEHKQYLDLLEENDVVSAVEDLNNSTIQNIKVNGVEQAVSDNTVNIEIPSGTTITHYNSYSDLPENAENGDFAIVDTETVLQGVIADKIIIPKGTYRLPTRDEYVYMLDTRELSTEKRLRATITDASDNGIRGLIILPDVFDLSLISEYDEDSYGKLMTSTEFKNIESLGATFLPCGGNIITETKEVDKFNVLGWYWTSTYDGFGRALMNHESDGISGNDNWLTNRPLSIRLVQDCESTDTGAIQVGEDSYFKFTKGNLQYEIDTKKWYIAKEQWEALGKENKTSIINERGKMDLLYFGSSGYNNRIPNIFYSQGVAQDIAGTEYDHGIYNDIYEYKDVIGDRIYKPGSAFMYNEDKKVWEELSGYNTQEEVELPDRVDALENKSSDIITELDTKVDKVEGKGLSTNDYTDEDKAKLDNISNPMQVKGRVDSIYELPTENVELGDVYLVGLSGSANFKEYVCVGIDEYSNGPMWECLGPPDNVPYVFVVEPSETWGGDSHYTKITRFEYPYSYTNETLINMGRYTLEDDGYWIVQIHKNEHGKDIVTNVMILDSKYNVVTSDINIDKEQTVSILLDVDFTGKIIIS